MSLVQRSTNTWRITEVESSSTEIVLRNPLNNTIFQILLYHNVFHIQSSEFFETGIQNSAFVVKYRVASVTYTMLVCYSRLYWQALWVRRKVIWLNGRPSCCVLALAKTADLVIELWKCSVLFVCWLAPICVWTRGQIYSREHRPNDNVTARPAVLLLLVID